MRSKGEALFFSIPIGPFRKRLRWPVFILTLWAACLLPARNLRAQENAQKPQNQTPKQSAPSSGQTQKQPPSPSGIQLQNPGTAPAEGPQKSQPQAPSNGGIQLQAPGVAPSAPKPKTTEQVQTIVTAIEFRGNRRIQSSSLMARIFTRPGQAYNTNDIERDFMALWNTGYFDDIRAVATDDPKNKNGKIITFFVREKKLVRSIDYKGMNSVTPSDVMDRFREEKVGLSIMSQYDPVVIKHAEVVVEEMLSENGRQFATVTARTRDIPPDSVALTFVVVEGPKVKVGKISFSGNTAFSNSKLIEAMKYEKPIGLPPWFWIFHRTYNHDKMEADLEKIRELYRNHGYFFALPGPEPIVHTVITHRRLPFIFFGKGTGRRVDVTIPIQQGQQYRLGRFVIRDNKLFKEDALKRVLGMNTGDIFNASKLQDALKNYTKLYGEYGYINFTANPDIEPDRQRHVINLALDFDEEHQYTVHRVNFSGNTKTRDEVIRRQILLAEGSVFNTALWDLSVYRINQLGYFDPLKPTSPDATGPGKYQGVTVVQNNQNHTVDLDVALKEKGRNSIGFSGGISGIAGTFVGANYATQNFLGLGDTLSISGQFGTFVDSAQIGVTVPYLFNRPMTAGFTLFLNDYHFDELQQYGALYGVNLKSQENTLLGQTYFQNYQQNSKGFSVFARYPLRHTFASLGLTYTFSVSSLETFSAASQSLFQSLDYGQFAGPSQLSGIKQSMVQPSYYYNNVDNPINPHRGKSISASVGFSGSILGGNVDTISPSFDFKYYHHAPFHPGHTLAFHFEGSTISGYDGKVPPPFQRFYMGGQYDIRGFNTYSISPVIFFPTVGQICNRDASGNPIWATGANGQRLVGTCGSYTSFPYNTIEVPGGDTMVLGSFEYRIPLFTPDVTLAYFIDAGDSFILRPNQLKLQPNALSALTSQFPFFQVPTSHLEPISGLNFHLRSSTGVALYINLPVVHAPIEVYYGYNWLRLKNEFATPPQELPPVSLFPNIATYDAVLPYFERQVFSEPHGLAGFTVQRSF
ncbi:MAG TPA: outer membrane protein assembly factor BamA [Terriglobia bacterium]|nr:outer membrane protein assembly factor BamA [Terriglobia bacterium]